MKEKCSSCCWKAHPQHTENSEISDEDKNELGQDLSPDYDDIDKTHGLPYRELLPIVLQVGRAICIRGKTLENCTRFSVNLLCGLEPKSNVALHFNPRLDQNYVVRNSRILGKWGEEETTAYCRPNMRWNEDFFLEFLPTSNEFMIAINNKHFCKYSHRIPINKITALVVSSKVGKIDVSFEARKSYPDFTKYPIEELQIIDDENYVPTNNFKPLPYCGRLPENFINNYQVTIYGRVKLLPRTFYINLQEGFHLWPHPIIHLHINPRFLGATDKNQLIKNSWIDDQWGTEERCVAFPFRPGKEFCMTLYAEDSQSFRVWVDNVLIAEFQSRTSVTNIDHVFIQGDVVVFDVHVEPKHTTKISSHHSSLTVRRRHTLTKRSSIFYNS
ncbi:galectin-6 isoform X2 [Agrilus planipennis]|uniref:Galectin n=1 Tax=Agrilus planipennis TaxID=224129 RepID=A0A1W4X3L5_AGRPL|nr:galectin-6 isoform X2 [Agrilus planipennis]